MSKATKNNLNAADLFERPAPFGYMDEWRKRLSVAREQAPDAVSATLVFRLEEEWLGLPNHAVSEVVAAAPAHRLPHRDNQYLLGLVNIRGELRIAMSLRALLGLKQNAAPSATDDSGSTIDRLRRPPRQIVLHSPDGPLVVPVDEVAGIAFVGDAAFQPVPDTLRKSLSNFVHAMFKHNDHAVGLLDEQRVLQGLKQKLV